MCEQSECANRDSREIYSEFRKIQSRSPARSPLSGNGEAIFRQFATPRVGEGDNFFLLTDAELEAYSVSHGGSHVFDASLYPRRSDASLQDLVDYDSDTLKR